MKKIGDYHCAYLAIAYKHFPGALYMSHSDNRILTHVPRSPLPDSPLRIYPLAFGRIYKSHG